MFACQQCRNACCAFCNCSSSLFLLGSASTNLQTMQKAIGAPSSFARVYNWPSIQRALEKQGYPLKYHRPGHMYGADVTLFYRGFDTFVEQCTVRVKEKLPILFTV